MQKWEYFACNMWFEKGKYRIRRLGNVIEDNDVWKYIGELGQKGWELVSVAPIVGSKTIMGLLDVQGREAIVTSGYFLW